MGTAISWTTETWNPVTGCSRVSEGCRHCYAERLSLKFGWSQQPWTAQNAKSNVRERDERLSKPYKIKTPSRIFVNSMSDMFHPLVSDDFIGKIFDVMADNPQHTFQILTKRPERLTDWPQSVWRNNIWMGTSIEDQSVLYRVDQLRQSKAHTRFLSAEPLLGPLHDLDLRGIHWVIVGGESGPGYRPMDHAWARSIRDQCVANRTAFFFKQDAAYRTETRCWLVEEDGSRWQWQQYPGNLTSPRKMI